MARIIITSAGTLGDMLPFIALGQALQNDGHSVRMAVNEAFHRACRRAGLKVAPCGPAFGPHEVRASADLFDFWHDLSLRRCLQHVRASDRPRAARELVAACLKADLLIASTVQGLAPLVREKLGIPWLSVSLLAMEFDGRRNPHAFGAPVRNESDSPEARILLRLANRLRSAVGLSRLPRGSRAMPCEPDRMILACSRHFCRPAMPRTWPARQTGFWFCDGDAVGSREPSPKLRAFVENGAPPLVLSLSSQPVRDPAHMLNVHVKAALRLDQRLVVQRGWAGLGADRLSGRIERQRVLFEDFLPHDWLFARSAALIHHGGIGTSARALRHGLPMLVEPHGNDQFYNTERLLLLGVGAAMNPHKLTIKGLVRVLSEKVLQPDMRKRAERVAKRLGQEDGLRQACALVTQMLEGRSWGSQRFRGKRL